MADIEWFISSWRFSILYYGKFVGIEVVTGPGTVFLKGAYCGFRLMRLRNELMNKDWFMTFPDFKSYCEAKDRALAAYEDRMDWAGKMAVNIAKSGYFSSDRTIEQYNDEIWHLERDC